MELSVLNTLPILRTLGRHRIAVSLIAIEIALSCAILCNGIFLISDRIAAIGVPSGLAEDELVYLQTGGAFPGGRATSAPIVQEHLTALRQIPGVGAAEAVNALPMSRNMWNFFISRKPDDKDATLLVSEFMATAGVTHTMGLKLVEGRDFTVEDEGDQKSFIATSAVAIIPRALARKLWPDGSAVGQRFYLGKAGYTVAGVVEHLAGESFGSTADADYSVLFPMRPGAIGGQYLLRCAPADRDRVLAAAAEAIKKVSPTVIILQRKTFADIRHDYFRQDQSLAGMLIGVCVLLVIVTALGIVGLASFWVQQRTRQIGIRRALGARRVDVLRYFQIENFLIVSIGILIGMAGAYALNLGLMNWYELPRLPVFYLPIGAAGLWLLGQIAVLGPALRAAAVPPVVATRSV